MCHPSVDQSAFGLTIFQSVLSYEHDKLDEPTIEVWNGKLLLTIGSLKELIS